MRIQILDKQIASKWVIVWIFEQDWNWSDFIDAVNATLEKIEHNPDICDIILNIRFEIADEHLAIPNFRQMIKKLTNCTFTIVMQGADLMTSVITNVLRENFSEHEHVLHIVHTVEDAHDLIESDYSLPDVKTTAQQTDQNCHCSDTR